MQIPTPMLAAIAILGCAQPAVPPADLPAIAWTPIEGSKGAAAAIKAAASSDERVPVLFVGAEWCGSCKAYKTSLTHPEMVAAHRSVHIIEVDADRHMRVVQALQVKPVGVPHWEKLDRSTGRSAGAHIDGRAWTFNTVAAMAPALQAFFEADTVRHQDD